MAIKVLVNGAFGRMGQLTVKTISQDGNFELVGQTGREYDLAKAIHDSNAEVVIDFTRADAAYENAVTIINAGARPIIGTSGLTHEHVKKLQELCTKLERGGILAPNFSLGAVLMMKCAKQIVSYMPNVEIIEMHHPDKVDSPSGTSLRSADMMAETNTALNPLGKTGHDTVKGSRGALYRDIPIHAVRLPGFLAHQQIIFGNTGETLTLRHDSIDRECFMPGVRFACKKVMELDHLVYGLEELL